LRVILLLRRFLPLLLCLLLMVPQCAYGADKPAVSADAVMLMDMASGTVLYERNANEPHAIASTTKLMTCLLACEAEVLQDKVTVKAEMLQGLEGTSLNLKAGDSVTGEDLVKGAMLASGNDAANALAFAVSGSVESFVELMNEKALLLGMQHTHFATPSGLDNGDNHSCAYDMALLACAAMRNAELAEIAAMKEAVITVNGVRRKIANHNKLLGLDSGFVGLKTGYTKKAGRCLISACRYENNTVICVTLGAPDDWNDHVKLAEYAKGCYRTQSDTVTVSIPLVGAGKEAVAAAAAYSVTACADVAVNIFYYPFAYCPVKEGDVLGYARICVNGAVLATEPMRATESVNL